MEPLNEDNVKFCNEMKMQSDEASNEKDLINRNKCHE